MFTPRAPRVEGLGKTLKFHRRPAFTAFFRLDGFIPEAHRFAAEAPAEAKG
jgi:hypothetical protein